jgi:hypothetical protein
LSGLTEAWGKGAATGKGQEGPQGWESLGRPWWGKETEEKTGLQEIYVARGQGAEVGVSGAQRPDLAEQLPGDEMLR